MKRLSQILIYIVTACCLCSWTFSASGFVKPASQPEIRVLTVQDAIQMALAYSPEILMAEAQAIRSEEAVRESRSLNLPQVFAGTGLAYNNGFPLSIEGAAPSIFQIGASQPIFSKKNANLIREAEQYRDASRLGTESTRNEIAMKTAMVYYELHRSRRGIELASEGLDDARRQQELVEELLTAGKVLPVEVTQARTAVVSAQQSMLVAQEQAGMAETELKELTGLRSSVSVRTSEPRIDSPSLQMTEEKLYQQALARTPEILQTEANVKAKEFHIEAEKGERLPRMEIISQYALFSRTNNYDDFFNRFTRNNFILGLSLQVPIFDGSRTSARVAQSRQEMSEEQYKLQRMKSDLKMNIQRGKSALRIARGASGFARRDLASAREMVQVNEALLESGRISGQEMANLRSQVLQKELALLEADQILFQRKLELLRTIGSLTDAIQ